MFNLFKNQRIILLALSAFLLPFFGFLFLLFTPWGKMSFNNWQAHSMLLAITGLVAFYTCFAAYKAYKNSKDQRVFIISLAFYTFGFVFFLHALTVPGFLSFNEIIFDVTEHYGLFFGSLVLLALLLPFTESGKESIFKRRLPIFWGLAVGLLGWFLAVAISPAVAETLESAVNLFIGATGLLFFTTLVFLWKQYSETKNKLLFYLIIGFAALINSAIIPFFYTEWNLLWWFFHLTFLSGFAVILAGVLKTVSHDGKGFEVAFGKSPILAKIGTKLIIGFVVVALLVGVVGFIGLSGVDKIGEAFKEVMEDAAPVAFDLAHLQHRLADIRLETLDYLITGKTSHLNELQKSFEKYRARKEDLIKREGPEGGKWTILISKLENVESKYKELSSELITLKDQGELAGVELDQIAQVREMEVLEFDLLAVLEERIIHEDEELAEQREIVVATTSGAQRNIFGFSALVILLGIGLGYFISRSISTPIQKLSKISKEISEGNFSLKAEIKSKDEIGILAQSFNQMTESLIETRKLPENIIRSMADSLMVVTPEAKIKEVNQATLDLLGYERKELVGEPIEKVFGRAAAAAAAAAADTIFKGAGLEKLIKEGAIKDKEMTYRAKKGEEIPVSISGSVMKDENGKMIGIVVSAKDMRELQKLQKERVEVAAAAETSKREFAEKMAGELEVKVKERTVQLDATNQQLKASNQQMEAANQQLAAAQKQLQDKIVELERFNKITMGREVRILELKEEVARLKGKKP